MTQKVTCPAEGCDESGLPESVAGHAQGKRDDAHSGLTYTGVLAEVGTEQPAESTDEPDTDEQSEADSEAEHGQTGLSFPENPDADDDRGEQASDMVDLPCGHESYNEAEAPDPPFGVSCESCGKSWVVRDE